MKHLSNLALLTLIATSACFVEIVETGTGLEAPSESDESNSDSDSDSGSGDPDEDHADPGATCGDGSLDPTESCDGEDLDGQTCESLGLAEGMLACTSTCTLDVSDCGSPDACGDGVASTDEECDGQDFRGRLCESFGFDGGELSCTPECTIDTAGCT